MRLNRLMQKAKNASNFGKESKSAKIGIRKIRFEQKTREAGGRTSVRTTKRKLRIDLWRIQRKSDNMRLARTFNTLKNIEGNFTYL